MDEGLAAFRSSVERELAELKAQFDKELMEQKFRVDNKAMFAAERVPHELLMHPKWKTRSFEAIKGKVGGFDDARLMQILVQAGAVRFRGENGNEFWGLLYSFGDTILTPVSGTPYSASSFGQFRGHHTPASFGDTILNCQFRGQFRGHHTQLPVSAASFGDTILNCQFRGHHTQLTIFPVSGTPYSIDDLTQAR